MTVFPTKDPLDTLFELREIRVDGDASLVEGDFIYYYDGETKNMSAVGICGTNFDAMNAPTDVEGELEYQWTYLV